MAQNMLMDNQNINQWSCEMSKKQLISKLEAFFLTFTLVDNICLKRGLQIRSKSAN